MAGSRTGNRAGGSFHGVARVGEPGRSPVGLPLEPDIPSRFRRRRGRITPYRRGASELEVFRDSARPGRYPGRRDRADGRRTVLLPSLRRRRRRRRQGGAARGRPRPVHGSVPGRRAGPGDEWALLPSQLGEALRRPRPRDARRSGPVARARRRPPTFSSTTALRRSSGGSVSPTRSCLRSTRTSS